MRLPDIEYGPVQRSSDTAAAPGEAARGTSKVLAEGLTLWGQELVKTQTQRAGVKLSEQLNQLEQDLGSREYVTAQELRDALGEDVEKLPPHLRAQLQVKSVSGELVDNDQIPMWAAFGPLYDRLASRALDASASDIPMKGWQTEFKDRAKEVVVSRKARLNETQMKAALTYMKTSQLADLESMRNTARTPQEFADVRAAAMRSNALDPVEKKKQLDLATEAEQLRPVLDASTENDPAAMRAQIARLEAGGEDVDHIDPKNRNQYVRQLRSQLEAREREQKEDKDKALKEEARLRWNNIFAVHDAARRARRRLTSAEYNKLIPRPGTVPEDEWRQMDAYLSSLTKVEKPKTNFATYWNITQSAMQNPEAFKEGKVTVIGPDGKPAQTTLPALYAQGLLDEGDFFKFTDLTRTAKTDDFVYLGAITDQEAINAALVEKKYDLKTTNADEMTEIGHLTSLVNQTLAVRAQAKKKPLEPGERDLIIREVLDREVKTKRTLWNYLPFTADHTRTLTTLGVRPEIAVALSEGTARGGRRMQADEVVTVAKDYAKYEPGIIKAWARYAGKKVLSPDTAVHLYYIVDRDKALIDEKLKGTLTGEEDKDNALRAAMAVQGYFKKGIR